MMSKLSKTEMIEIIESYQFRSSSKFNNDELCLKFLISYIKELRISTDVLNLMIKLIRFYKFPILICFEPLYQKLLPSQVEFYEIELREVYEDARKVMGGIYF